MTPADRITALLLAHGTSPDAVSAEGTRLGEELERLVAESIKPFVNVLSTQLALLGIALSPPRGQVGTAREVLASLCELRDAMRSFPADGKRPAGRLP